MRGFSLVEGLIAVFLTTMIALFIAGLLTSFGIYNRDNFLHTCLVQAAGSAIEACRGGVTINEPVDCTVGDRTVRVAVVIQGNCNIQNGCNNVRATATAEGRSFELEDVVCNFRR